MASVRLLVYLPAFFLGSMKYLGLYRKLCLQLKPMRESTLLLSKKETKFISHHSNSFPLVDSRNKVKVKRKLVGKKINRVEAAVAEEAVAVAVEEVEAEVEAEVEDEVEDEAEAVVEDEALACKFI